MERGELLNITNADYQRVQKNLGMFVGRLVCVSGEDEDNNFPLDYSNSGSLEFYNEEAIGVWEDDELDNWIDKMTTAYNEAVAEEMNESGDGLLLRVSNKIEWLVLGESPFYRTAFSKTRDILPPSSTSEPLEKRYVKEMIDKLKLSYTITEDGGIETNFEWYYSMLDDSISSWIHEEIEDIEEEDFKFDYELGFVVASLGNALREQDKLKSQHNITE